MLGHSDRNTYFSSKVHFESINPTDYFKEG